MPADDSASWVFFVAVSSFVLLIFTLLSGRRNRLDTRLGDLANRGGPTPPPDSVADFARSTLPKMGAALVPKDEEERTRLQTRLIHAGLYSRQAMVFFLGVKVCLIIGPALLGLFLGLLGLVSVQEGVIFGAIVGLSGMIGPSFWLDRRKTERQTSFRRALPDALDVLVICLEGGLSLPAGLRRVAEELRTAHPKLGAELNIVQREAQMGLSSGEALRQFAERSDLEEIRSLASVVIQSERYGASLVKALRVHAETLRIKRLQYAEEMAQKAATKVLFPTVLFILPALFIVILGPAVIQITRIFGNLHK
ncbi:MAG: type II secretion system F family protein [Planctomycetes bacterium]|nr:type II secretion system F family protein [Planctomycetota bacterium]